MFQTDSSLIDSVRYDLDATPNLDKGLLTTENPKTVKGEGVGYLTAILHLAPASPSGRNVCSHATDGCRAACLNTAGRGGIGLDADGLNGIQVARIRRTRWFQMGPMARAIRFQWGPRRTQPACARSAYTASCRGARDASSRPCGSYADATGRR